jgi:4-amino-4-deoxy-L-arabinose transferase-like glycosyltransferase
VNNLRKEWIAVAAVAAFGAAVRLWGLEWLPPALWSDEGLNGCDALRLGGEGGWPLVFAAVFPREPLLVYAIAPFVKLLGPETFAVRLAPALIGSLAPLFMYFWLRQAANRRAALLAALFLAGMRWHVHFSRIAFRTIWTPTLALAALGLMWTAFRTGRKRWAAASGGVTGLGVYAYLSWYFFLPVAALAFVLGLRRETEKGRRGGLVGAFCLAAVVVAVPLAIHYLRAPEDAVGRTRELSLFAEGVGPGFKAIGKNAGEAALMLFWRGDHVVKHNIPWRPALEPLGVGLFLLGLAWACLNWRKSTLAAILPVWIVAGTLPTVFSRTDSPNFLRTLIVTPAVAACAGLGAAWVSEWYERRGARRVLSWGLSTVWVGASVAAMLGLYFGTWGGRADLWGAFSGQPDQIARYVREAAGEGLVFVPPAICPEGYAESPTFHFLVAKTQRARQFSYSEAFGPGSAPEADHLIVESPMIDPRVFSALALRCPGRELDREFAMPSPTPGEGPMVWARAWRLRPGERLSAEAAMELEKEINGGKD